MPIFPGRLPLPMPVLNCSFLITCFNFSCCADAPYSFLFFRCLSFGIRFSLGIFCFPFWFFLGFSFSDSFPTIFLPYRARSRFFSFLFEPNRNTAAFGWRNRVLFLLGPCPLDAFPFLWAFPDDKMFSSLAPPSDRVGFIAGLPRPSILADDNLALWGSSDLLCEKGCYPGALLRSFFSLGVVWLGWWLARFWGLSASKLPVSHLFFPPSLSKAALVPRKPSTPFLFKPG